MLSRIIILGFFLFLLTVFPSKVFADSIVLNEVLVHPSAGAKEWVEFYTSDLTTLRTYWIDDDTDFSTDSGNSPKKSLESVLQGNDSQHYMIDLSGSMFNNTSDVVILFRADGSIADQIQYTDDPGYDVTFGRSPDGTGSFYILDKATRGNTNSGPEIAPTSAPQPTARPTQTNAEAQTVTTTRNTSRNTNTSSSSTAVRTPTPIRTVPTLANSPSPQASASVVRGTRVASQGAYPTAVLGANTKAEPTAFQLPSIPVKVKGASDAPAIFTIVGAGFIIACAVVVFIRKLKQAG